MAVPFYSKADQDIYKSGQHFIPQEQYRLGPYTPPAIMGQNTNAGIVNTSAAGSYMGYPSYEEWLLAQGGGGGGGNDPVANINRGGVNQNLGPTNITDYESEAYGVGPTFRGSIARLQDLYSKLPTPGNLIMKGIRHWKQRREIKKEQERIAEDRTGIGEHDRGTFTGDHPDAPTKTPEQGGWHPGVGGGGQPHGTDTSGDFAGKGSGNPFGRAQGGRIGYANGGDWSPDWDDVIDPSDPDQPDPNWQPDWDDYLASDDNNTRILENLFEKYLELGFSPQDAEIKAMEEFELMSQGPEQDQGIASLV